MLYVMKEWESPVSGWRCGCIDNLAHDSGVWYLPARVLGISPAEFIELLITKFKPDHFHYSFGEDGTTCFVDYSWDFQSKMREFKNYINAQARKNNFQI